MVATTELSMSDTASLAATALRRLKNEETESDRLTIQFEHGPVTIPRMAFDAFVRILTELSQGHLVRVVPVHAELSTQQAAKLLNVSRPYVIKLLDEKKIPFKMVGNRRRIMLNDLVSYKRTEDAHRKKIFDELAEEAQKLGLDY